MIRKLLGIIAAMLATCILTLGLPMTSAEAAYLDEYMTKEQNAIKAQINGLRTSQGQPALEWNQHLHGHSQSQAKALAAGAPAAFPDAPGGWTYGFSGLLMGSAESAKTGTLYQKNWSVTTKDVKTMVNPDATAIGVGIQYQGSNAFVVVEIVAANKIPPAPVQLPPPVPEVVQKQQPVQEPAPVQEPVPAQKPVPAPEPEPVPAPPTTSAPPTAKPTESPVAKEPTPSPTPSTETSVPATDAPAREEEVQESIRKKLDAERAAEVKTRNKSILSTTGFGTFTLGLLALVPLPFLRYRKPPVRPEQPEDPLIDDDEQ